MKYIHIAGTNAKGSVANFLSNILGLEYKCGVFTSPHLYSPLERMCINNISISQKEYDKYMGIAQEQKDLHMFHYWTFAAINWFNANKIDYAVIETGLGGRLDPTNTIDSHMQIITPISLDHTHILGNTPLEIAKEKCGIIKEDSIVITYRQQKDVLRLINQVCKAKNCQLIVLNERNISLKSATLLERTFDFVYDDTQFKNIKINYISPSSVLNACACIIASVKLNINTRFIIQGLANANNVARCQYVDNSIIDGAHNEAAFIELKQTLDIFFTNIKKTVVVALMEDKNISEIVAIIKSFAYNVIVCCADKNRGMSAEELSKYFDKAVIVNSPTEAYTYAKSICKDGLTVVCGSYYLCAPILSAIEQKA